MYPSGGGTVDISVDDGVVNRGLSPGAGFYASVGYYHNPAKTLRPDIYPGAQAQPPQEQHKPVELFKNQR